MRILKIADSERSGQLENALVDLLWAQVFFFAKPPYQYLARKIVRETGFKIPSLCERIQLDIKPHFTVLLMVKQFYQCTKIVSKSAPHNAAGGFFSPTYAGQNLVEGKHTPNCIQYTSNVGVQRFVLEFSIHAGVNFRQVCQRFTSAGDRTPPKGLQFRYSTIWATRAMYLQYSIHMMHKCFQISKLGRHRSQNNTGTQNRIEVHWAL